jgi:hypothetical protein
MPSRPAQPADANLNRWIQGGPAFAHTGRVIDEATAYEIHAHAGVPA